MPNALPPLSPRELHLLSAFLIHRYDLVQLAEREKLHPSQLLAFARSPAVQAHLAELRAFADQAFALRSLESRTSAIDLLEQVAKSSDNPIEKRRTATAILRGLCPVGGTPWRPRHSPSSPTGGGARAAGGGGSVPTRSTDSRLHPPGRPRSTASHHDDDPSDSSTLSHPPPHTPHSPPLATPSPEISDHAAAHLILSTLRQPRDPHNIATLRAFCMPPERGGAKLAGVPIPTDPASFSRRVIEVLTNHQSPNVQSTSLTRVGLPSPVHLLTSSPVPDPGLRTNGPSPHSPLSAPHSPPSRFHLTTAHISTPPRTLSLELRRESGSWLLSSLNPGPNAFPEEPP